MSTNTYNFKNKSIRFLLVVMILFAGAGISFYWFKNKPSTKRSRPEQKARLVEIKPLTLISENVIVNTMGTVVPSQKVQVGFRVAGTIVRINPGIIPGAFLPKGTLIAKIDKQDYEIVLEQKQGELAKAMADKAMEMGQQAIALKEIELLDQHLSDADKSLVLRKPQLKKINAMIKNALSSVKKAKLDLKRTSVFSPFDSIVQDKHVEIGALAGIGSPLVTLYGTKEYRVEVLIPQDDLKWIEVFNINDKKGSEVRIYNEQAWGVQNFKTGYILKMKPELDSKSRMACIIVRINDPLDLKKSAEKRLPLLSGSYVKVAISGKKIKDVIKINRNYIHDGNTIFLLKTPENILEIRKIEILWSDASYIYTKDLLKEKFLITTDIGSAVDGMALRTENR